ncbi:uncharacterized protein BCR38DRAFT_504690 [Pseudomassariella vexata]|uniref:Fe2OG dioxygenase domain-containing protein n=1 Tax=Pseudomassariella vexata TaxID=1141098 RepID=A0A1Y2DCF9_9PEZI|nr:uncharacterized protein BCR38DRAFT_504690 [Pseudomassariella vexata]ORY56953.1 hypothetical protein BCR38DRAFT_504690 [Pseudomassariella vexata]
MATKFVSVPIVDLAPLSTVELSEEALIAVAKELHEVFATTGFAYLINSPLSFSNEEILGLAREFFSIDEEKKMALFPCSAQCDNFKEGFEMGCCTPNRSSSTSSDSPFTLTEPNVFPPLYTFPSRHRLEILYTELLSLSRTLLALLALSLEKPSEAFTELLTHSVSTLCLLHYPAVLPSAPSQELSCSEHTDSGLLTLLVQDATGGLEGRNAAGDWIPAPYVPGSLVVNIGDLMAMLSGGKFVATSHRVQSVKTERFSVPFFCEPGADEWVGEKGKKVRYEDWVLGKMKS